MERNVQMNIRVSEEEKALFVEAARRCGLTLSQYIRMKLAGRTPRQLPPTEYYRMLEQLTLLYQQDNTPEVQQELLNTLLAIQTAVTRPAKEE